MSLTGGVCLLTELCSVSAAEGVVGAGAYDAAAVGAGGCGGQRLPRACHPPLPLPQGPTAARPSAGPRYAQSAVRFRNVSQQPGKSGATLVDTQ